MKSKLLLIIIFMGVLAIGMSVPVLVSADSGWDNDYGGSSSSYSGSSGSSYDSHSHSYSSSSDGEHDSESDLYTFLFFVYIGLHAVILILTNNYKEKNKIVYDIFNTIWYVLLGVDVISIVGLTIFMLWGLWMITYFAYQEYPKATIIVGALCVVTVLIMIYGGRIKNNINNRIAGNRKFKKNIRDEKNNMSLEMKEAIDSNDIPGLEQKIYNLFVEVQEAWMNFDYKKLEKLCGSQLYESYKSDLEVLHSKNQKNVMNSFKYLGCYIKKVEKDKKCTNISAILHVSFKDYVISENTNFVVKGDKHRVYDNVYELDFIMKTNVIAKCPSCGSKLKGNKCDYCNTIVENNSEELVLVNKKIINK